MAIFGTVLNDFVFAFVLGAIGGFAAELIANKGSVEIPNFSTGKTSFWDLGLFSNILLGGIAALAYFFILETTDQYKFVGVMIGAGVGGSAVLTAIKERIISTEIEGNAEVQNLLMKNTANTVNGVLNQVNTLETSITEKSPGSKVNIETLKTTLMLSEESIRNSIKTSEENLKKITKARKK